MSLLKQSPYVSLSQLSIQVLICINLLPGHVEYVQTFLFHWNPTTTLPLPMFCHCFRHHLTMCSNLVVIHVPRLKGFVFVWMDVAVGARKEEPSSDFAISGPGTWEGPDC